MESMHRSLRGCALRKGRYSEAGRVYLLTSVTQNREPIFSDWRLGRLLVREMRMLHDGGQVVSLAWVIMPDHLHWLVELGQLPLDTLMRQLNSRSAIAINRRRGRRDRLWQKGFRDHALRRDEDIQSIARYVVANPLRAGLVGRVGDYPLWDAAWL